MAWTNFCGENSWTRLSLIGDETVINLQRTKSMYSRVFQHLPILLEEKLQTDICGLERD